MVYEKVFLYFSIIFFLLLYFILKESVALKWLELVPKYAYSFVPEAGVTEEMWEDEIFLKKK